MEVFNVNIKILIEMSVWVFIGIEFCLMRLLEFWDMRFLIIRLD